MLVSSALVDDSLAVLSNNCVVMTFCIGWDNFLKSLSSGLPCYSMMPLEIWNSVMKLQGKWQMEEHI